MTDTPPTKRSFWQIHLSTVLLMTLLASVFVFVNCRPTIAISLGSVRHLTLISARHETRYGWPGVLLISRRAFSAETKHLPKDESSPETWRDRVLAAIDRDDIKTGDPEYSVQTSGLAADIATLLLISTLSASISEYLIRRTKP